MRFWKIVATLGPASYKNKKTLKRLCKEVDMFRINLSHADLQFTEEILDFIRNYNPEKSFFIDTKWPEIRTRNKEEVFIKKWENFIVRSENKKITESKLQIVPIDYDKIGKIPIWKTISFDDEKLIGKIIENNKEYILVKSLDTGKIGKNKTVNFRWFDPELDFLTQKDKDDITWWVKNNVKAIAASFIKFAEDIERLRNFLKELDAEDVKIIPKIETIKSIENIDSIIQASDGIMIARGDLGASIPLIDLPKIQTEIIEKCNIYGKPVILATQVLLSMVSNPRPTRAELDEVAYNASSWVDAFMLSDESAIGDYPVETVDYLAKIIKKYQKDTKKKFTWKNITQNIAKENRINDYFLYKIKEISEELPIKLIVCPTESGETPSKISALKPHIPLLTLTKNKAVKELSGILWWVKVFLLKKDDDFWELKKLAKRGIEEIFPNLLKEDDMILIVGSQKKQGVSKMINSIEIIKRSEL